MPAALIWLIAALALAGAGSGAHGRYLIPTIPFGILLALTGLGHLSRRIHRKRYEPVFLMLAILCLGWQVYAMERMGKVHGRNVENINHMQRLLANTLLRNTSVGDTVAVNDVGAMGYFSRCYIVDLVGLVSPPRSFHENLRLYRPKYLVIFPDWYQQYFTVENGRSVIYAADSLSFYAPVVGAGLRFNSISARDQMFVLGRFARGERGPNEIKMVWN